MTDLNLAFYTYFYGSDNNPAFMIPDIPSSSKYNFFYYTNNQTMFAQLKNTKWIGIFHNKPTNDDHIESCMVGKHIKSMPHEYNELKDYDYLCFFDSKSYEINIKLVENHINRFFINKNYALLLREHSFINSYIWNEYEESMKQYRYTLESEKYKKYILNQIDNGFDDITEYHYTCSLLLRNMKHKKMIEINNTWYDHIQECGIQDQISFFFVKQLYEDFIHPFLSYL